MTTESLKSLPDSYPHPVHIAVIGGTGLETLPGFTPVAALHITTPWGTPSSPITIAEHQPSSTSSTSKSVPIAFLARHGINHQYPPRSVPARANIAALRKLGVRTIIAFSAAGSLKEEVRPRDFVVPDQIIDRTQAREGGSFFEEKGFVVHVPFADPFDREVREVVVRCGRELEGEVAKEGKGDGGKGFRVHDGGTVVCIEGPMFSTRAESRMYRAWGGTVINMSSIPEAKLAAEAEMAYAGILMSTDYDCWHDSGDVTVEMVMGNMRANVGNARKLVGRVLDELSKEENRGLVEARHLEGGRKVGISTKEEGREKGVMEKMEWLFPGYF